jgi:hypothetical protein
VIVVATVAVDVAELLAVFESAVVLLTFAVLVMAVPAAAALLELTTIVNDPVAPDVNVVKLHVTVPVPPAGGLAHAAVGPLFCASDTNVVPAGTASVIATLCASPGPLLVTVIV